MTARNKILAIVTILSFGVIFLFKYTWHTPATTEEPPGNTTHAVILSENGFDPQKIVIKKGDTVIFTSVKRGWFWPASNPHPTHTTYTNFDPQEPISSDKSWSFTFTETGEWRYHDHLAPYFIGTVTVSEIEETVSTNP